MSFMKKRRNHVNSKRKLEGKMGREQKLLKVTFDHNNSLMGGRNSHDDLTVLGKNNIDSTISVNQELTYTVSIAVPGSIMNGPNSQSSNLKTYLAIGIARAACIYCIDEIIVFDDLGSQKTQIDGVNKLEEGNFQGFVQLLQNLECPQYLRKYLFPLNKDLKTADLLCPLDAPHHLQQSDNFPFREGVVSHHLLKQGKGSYVNVGLQRDVCVQKALAPGTRVTVHLQPQKEGTKKRFGEVVPPSLPRQLMGVYWGYSVRLASSFSEVFTKAPYQEGYDLTIGTSENGTAITDCPDSDFQGFRHVLIVFGGSDGLESALECDVNLNINNVSLLFDKYLNTCPKQGSRTIRTEEALLVTLALIIPRLQKR